MAIEIEPYLPIPGLEYLIYPRILRYENLWKTQLYAEDSDLTVLSSQDIHKVKTGIDRPNEFLSYALEKTDLTESDVINGRRQLEDQIRQFRIRAKEILITSLSPHPRIIAPDESPEVPFLIADYSVRVRTFIDYDKDVIFIDREEWGGFTDYDIDVSDIEPDPRVPIKWSYGKISQEIAQLLGAKKSTRIWTNTIEPNEGVWALIWNFTEPYIGPQLHVNADLGLWVPFTDIGSLLGKKL